MRQDPRITAWVNCKIAGLSVPVALLCLAVTGAVAVTGLRHQEPMIGDEVTHFYMLRETAKTLPQPSFESRIPNGWSEKPYVRLYPHPNGWHYIGAIVYRLTGNSFAAVQLYQAVFLLQLLWVTGLWARRLSSGSAYASWLAVLTVGTLPMGLLFSVAFYQDVAVAAQLLTAFFFLYDRRRPFAGVLFMIFALWMKTSAIVLLPLFLVLLWWESWRQFSAGARKKSARARWTPAAVSLLCSVLLIGSIFHIQSVLIEHAGTRYYPVAQVRQLIKAARRHKVTAVKSAPRHRTEAEIEDAKPAKRKKTNDNTLWQGRRKVISNHPGDLRNPINLFLYGGGLVWAVTLLGCAVAWRQWRAKRRPHSTPTHARMWPLVGSGLFYTLATAWQLRTAPDARFFLPAVPFLMIPLAVKGIQLPRMRLLLAGITLLGAVQAGAVLTRTHRLRVVPQSIYEAIEFLEREPITPPRLFMYPEGNYRLFPYPPEWYMNYWLREFWRAGNDERIEALRRFEVGAIVIKKHLVAEAGEPFNNLGIYPVSFVRDIHNDSRFPLLFENDAVLIYGVPADDRVASRDTVVLELF